MSADYLHWFCWLQTFVERRGAIAYRSLSRVLDLLMQLDFLFIRVYRLNQKPNEVYVHHVCTSLR